MFSVQNKQKLEEKKRRRDREWEYAAEMMLMQSFPILKLSKEDEDVAALVITITSTIDCLWMTNLSVQGR